MKKILLYPAIALELLWHTALPLLWVLDIFYSVTWVHYLIFSFPCLTLTPVALLTMRPANDNRKPIWYDRERVQRYRLPHIFRWMETPDELLPGGLYEDTVYGIYRWFRDRLGERAAAFFTGWYWLGTRNIGQYIPWKFGKEVTTNKFDSNGRLIGHEEVWQKTKEIQIFRWKRYVVWGWEVNRDWQSLETDRGYWAVPGYFSIRKKPKGG